MYTARVLVDHARSIADLQNTKFISYNDEVNYLNEAYRDVYSRYTESSGDYWSITSVLSVTSANQEADANGWSWLIDLPTDFYKLRSASWGSGGQWFPMQSFAMSQRDFAPTSPMYRLKGSQLWVISTSQPQVKIQYYPPPDTITLPNETKDFLTSLTQYQRLSILYPYYIPENNALLFVNGNDIQIQSLATGTTTTLFTSVNAKSYVTYYKGYIYWVESGNVRRAPTDLLTTLVPTNIVATGTVVRLWVFRNKIYYTTTSTLQANLDGTGSSTYNASVLNYLCPYGTASIAYLNGSGALFIDGVAIGAYTGLVGLASDGVYLYIQDAIGLLNRLTVVAGLVTDTDLIASDIQYVGTAINDDYLPVITDEDTDIQAISTVLDFEFSFPSNEVWELLAYSSALKYATKSDDQAKLSSVSTWLGQLWERFDAVNKRDEYQVYRINNDYNAPSRWPYGGY